MGDRTVSKRSNAKLHFNSGKMDILCVNNRPSESFHKLQTAIKPASEETCSVTLTSYSQLMDTSLSAKSIYQTIKTNKLKKTLPKNKNKEDSQNKKQNTLKLPDYKFSELTTLT